MSESAIFADADLTIRAGTTEGHLSGSGSDLSFTTSHLGPFLDSMPKLGRRTLVSTAEGLASAGMSVSIVEDGAAVLEIGAVRSSLLARVVGVRNVRIRRPVRLLARYLRR